LRSLVTIYLPNSETVLETHLVDVLLEKMLHKSKLVFKNGFKELVVGTVQVIEHPRMEKLQLGQEK
jgi:hypothetical protein